MGYKLRFRIGKGASGQIRLLYVVNEKAKIIKLLWIYSHEEFPKRPADSDLRTVLRLALEED